MDQSAGKSNLAELLHLLKSGAVLVPKPWRGSVDLWIAELERLRTEHQRFLSHQERMAELMAAAEAGKQAAQAAARAKDCFLANPFSRAVHCRFSIERDLHLVIHRLQELRHQPRGIGMVLHQQQSKSPDRWLGSTCNRGGCGRGRRLAGTGRRRTGRRTVKTAP